MMTTRKLMGIFVAVTMAIASIASISPVSANDCPHNDDYSYCPSFKADKATAQRGDVISYTATVVNNGSATLHTVFMAENFSPYVTYVAGSTTATKGSQTVNVTDAWLHDGLNLGDLQVDQKVTVHFQAKVNNDAPDSAFIESTAQFKTNDLPNWIQCAAQTTLKPNDNPHYKPSKTVDHATAHRGDTLTYTLKMVNDGNIALHSAFISDHLPTGVTYVAGSTYATKGGQTVQVTDAWLKDGLNLGDLAIDQTATVTFKVKVNGDVTNGQLLENTGQFKTNELPNWIQCAAQTKVVVKTTPTPTPTPTATPTPTPSPTGEVLGATPTPTPPTELPATGPGIALVVALTSTTAGLIGRKYWLAR